MSISRLWPLALLTLGLAGDHVFFCGTLAVALAVAAAYALRLRGALALCGAVWAFGQLVGFTVGGFPHTADTLAWGIALGAATALAVGVGRAFATRAPWRAALGAPVAFAAAFVAYEVALLAFGLARGEGASAFTPAIVLAVLQGNVLFGLLVVAVKALVDRLPARDTGRSAVR